MPELPEVEALARRLHKVAAGRRVTGCMVLWNRTVDRPSAARFRRDLLGATIVAVGRRAKYLVCSLDSGSRLLIHLRMSGDIFVSRDDQPIDPHVRVALKLSGGKRLDFHDPRKFGRMYLVSADHEVLGGLGVEPLSSAFTPALLGDLLRGSKRRIKALLLDQSVVAGLGNIYVIESLWRAGIHPCRAAGSLGEGELRDLCRAIRAVLGAAVKAGGTDLGDGVWKSGRFTPRIYGREEHPCPRCRTELRRIVVAQRGTVYCVQCQPAGRG